MCKLRLWATLLALPFWTMACAHAPKAPHDQSIVDFLQTDDRGTVRVILDSRGAARVDFAGRENTKPRTFLVPTNGAEVERLAAWLAAIDKARIRQAPLEIPMPGSPPGTFVMTFRYHGRTGRLNFTWNGGDPLLTALAEEVQEIGLVSLARAYDEFTAAKNLEAGPGADPGTSVSLLCEAVQEIRTWTERRALRYCRIFEPEIAMRFRYTTADGEDKQVKGIPTRTTDLPGITEGGAKRAWHYYWQQYAAYVAVGRVDDAVILTPKSWKDGWAWGLSQPDIPQALAREIVSLP